MNDFYLKVYEIVKKIPKGKVCTYGDIAAYIGTKGSARTVGYAMNHAHTAPFYVPAHRVVNRNGMLTGKHHFENSTMMQELLESEGIQIKNDIIQKFETKRWYPSNACFVQSIRKPVPFNLCLYQRAIMVAISNLEWLQVKHIRCIVITPLLFNV